MNRKISLGAAATFTVLLMLATFCLTMIFSNQMFNNKLGNVKEREQMYEKLSEIDTVVRSKYDGDIDSATLFDGLSAGYMRGLNDEYATYLTAAEYTAYQQSLNGETVSIGVTVSPEASGYLQIAEVLTGSPAEEAKLEVGDLIISVNGTVCTAENAESLAASLSGKAGTTLVLVYRRAGEDKTLELVRKQFEVQNVLYKALSAKIGYIHILRFDDKTENQFKAAMQELTAKGCTGFVFDVRNTKSNDLSAVAKVLQQLVPEGPLVIAQYKDKTTKVLYQSTSTGADAAMTVLVNEGTSQGAELFAAALRDYGKANLVGTQTAGKGMVQELTPLSDGSALWITVAQLNPPKSESFNKTGLKPDYIQPLTETAPNAINSMDPEQDVQLKKAMDVLLGTAPLPESESQAPSASASTPTDSSAA